MGEGEHVCVRGGGACEDVWVGVFGDEDGGAERVQNTPLAYTFMSPFHPHTPPHVPNHPQELVRHYGTGAPPATMEATVKEAATLVHENDLLLSAHALQLMSIALQQQPAVATSVTATTLPAAMQLVQSPLLQGSVLEALQHFFKTLAGTTNSGAAIEEQLLAVGAAEVCVWGGVRCVGGVHAVMAWWK